MTGVLFRNELIKIRHRLAFWVTLLTFTGLLTLIFGGAYYQKVVHGRGSFVLPDAWPEIIGETGPLGPFFAAVVIVLLITSEFSWRTARQNVIDGLSKEQWFAAKLMLLPLAVVAFVVVQMLLGSGFAAAATDFGEAASAIPVTHDLAAFGGLGLATVGFCSLAFLISFAVRSSGPAVALFFLYVAIVEQLVLGPLMRRWEALAEAARFLPGTVFMRLLDGVQYYPEAVERAVQAAEKAGREAPVILPTSQFAVAAGIYAVLFVAAAFMIYRKRDL